MTSSRIRKWLESKIDVGAISGPNRVKLELQDQIIVSHIENAIDGNTSSFKLLHDIAYGILKPGEGPHKEETDDEFGFEVDFGLPDEKEED